jgi:hypothetical protein
MTDATDGPDFIGDPGAVLADDTLSHEAKRDRLTAWRDALRADAHDAQLNLDSGEANRLMEIERALHRLDEGEA